MTNSNYKLYKSDRKNINSFHHANMLPIYSETVANFFGNGGPGSSTWYIAVFRVLRLFSCSDQGTIPFVYLSRSRPGGQFKAISTHPILMPSPIAHCIRRLKSFKTNVLLTHLLSYEAFIVKIHPSKYCCSWHCVEIRRLTSVHKVKLLKASDGILSFSSVLNN